MEITVNVDKVDLNTVVGEHRVYDHEFDRYSSEPMTIADAVVEKLFRNLVADRAEINRAIGAIRTEVIRERVTAEVEAALSQPFQPVNQYGEKTGKETTLREEIARIAQDAVRLDKRNSFSREDTAAEKVIRDEVNRALDKELKETVAAEKAKVVAAVRAKAADLIAQAVKEGIGR